MMGFRGDPCNGGHYGAGLGQGDKQSQVLEGTAAAVPWRAVFICAPCGKHCGWTLGFVSHISLLLTHHAGSSSEWEGSDAHVDICCFDIAS